MTPLAKHLIAVAPLAITLIAACSDQPAPTGPAPASPASPASPALVGASAGPIVLAAVDLGTLGGDMNPAGINDLGLIAGDYFDDTYGDLTYGTTVAFTWRDGQFAGLGVLGSYIRGIGLDAHALALNDAGQIVGYRSSDPTTAFVSRDGATQTIAMPDTATRAEAHGINAAGEVVGGVLYASGRHAALWSATGVMQDLGTFGGTDAAAVDINGRGEVLGYRTVTPDLQTAFVARGTSVRELGTLGGSVTPRAINELGEAAGLAVASDASVRAFLWQPATGAMQALPTGGSSGRSEAYGLNELGQVVGVARDATNTAHAALWQDGEIHFLDLPAGAAGGASEAIDINNAGQVVGTVEDGISRDRRLVLWTVPLGATVDVAPGDASNSIPLGSKGTVAVAVITTPYLDASRVVPSSLALGNADANDAPVMVKRDGTPSVVFKDVDRDGDQDLVAQFDKDVLKQKGDLTIATTRLVLRGQLQNGKPIRGANAVKVSP